LLAPHQDGPPQRDDRSRQRKVCARA
jgi:hypothetical protein